MVESIALILRASSPSAKGLDNNLLKQYVFPPVTHVQHLIKKMDFLAEEDIVQKIISFEMQSRKPPY